MDYQPKIFKIISMSDSVKVVIDVNLKPMLDELSDRNIIYSLLNNFSGVGDLTISWQTLMIIYTLKDMNPLPKFHDLARLRATMCSEVTLELLPIVLERCPKLKQLTLELASDNTLAVRTRLPTVVPRCLVSSLESVEMESPSTEEGIELKLVRYFLKDSTTLQKLVLRLIQLRRTPVKKHKLGVLKRLIKYPRRSSLCQLEVVQVALTPNPLLDWCVYTIPDRFFDDFENGGGHEVVIDTPRLEYLSLKDYQYRSFEIVSVSETVKVDVDVFFEAIGGNIGALMERNIICNFLTRVSNIRDMTMSRRTLGFIYHHYLEMNPLFKFHELARLRVTMFLNSSPKMLPVILETSPNLKFLTLELVHDSLVTKGRSRLLTLLPRCLLSSLESVSGEVSNTQEACSSFESVYWRETRAWCRLETTL